MISADEKLVSEVVSARGLHTAKIIRFGQPVDVDAWVEHLVPDRAQETWTFWDDVEDPKGLNCHTLLLHWKERGAVDFREIIRSLADGTQNTLCVPVLGTNSNGIPSIGVLWWIAPGENLSFSADVAATVHKRCYGAMPSVAWVRKLPAGAIDRTPLARTNSDARVRTIRVEVGEGDDHRMLELRTGDWVPERFVVVGNT